MDINAWSSKQIKVCMDEGLDGAPTCFLTLRTDFGYTRINTGDWIVQGGKADYYPVSDAAFAALYKKG